MNISKKSIKCLILLFVTECIFLINTPLLAQSSTNYKIKFDVLNQAGALSGSPNYQLQDCFGQPSAVGNSAGGNYLLSAGFLAKPSLVISETINLAGGWSWVSFNLEPLEKAMDNVFAGMSHLVIVVDGAGRFYIPGVINSIGEMNIVDGYKVYFDAPENLILSGIPVIYNMPIELAAGWNFIAYLPPEPLDCEVALGSVLPDLLLVKDDTGKFFIPGVINTLGKMYPGKGYKMYMKKNATLAYPLIVDNQNSVKAVVLQKD